MFVQRRVYFQIELAVHHTQLVGLVDYGHRSAHRHLREQLGHILVVHAETAVTDPHADPEGLVGAMDHVTAQSQIHLVRPHRVVRARRHHRRQYLALGSMLLADGPGRIPGGIGFLACHPGLAYRRGPALPADTYRPGTDPLLIPGIEIHPVFRKVDDDALARRVRQDMHARQGDRRAVAGQPGIHSRVGCHYLVETEAVGIGQVRQGILIARLEDANFTHQLLPARGQRIVRRLNAAQRHSHPQRHQPSLQKLHRGSPSMHTDHTVESLALSRFPGAQRNGDRPRAWFGPRPRTADTGCEAIAAAAPGTPAATAADHVHLVDINLRLDAPLERSLCGDLLPSQPQIDIHQMYVPGITHKQVLLLVLFHYTPTLGHPGQCHLTCSLP